MMTAIEVYKMTLGKLKKEDTTTITPSEFNEHISSAMIDFVNNRYWAHDQHQKSIDDLSIIKVMTDGVGGSPQPIVALGLPAPNVQYIVLPEDYLHLLNISAVVEYYGVPCKKDGTLSAPIACTHLTDDREKLVGDDYYSKPFAEFPRLYYSHRGNQLIFKAGNSIVKYVYINYLRYPKYIKVDETTGQSLVDSEFGDAQTLEIIDILVKSYLEKIEEPRFQTNIIEGQTKFLQHPQINNFQ